MKHPRLVLDHGQGTAQPGGNGFDDGLAPVQGCLFHGRDQGRVTLGSISPIVIKTIPKSWAILEVKKVLPESEKGPAFKTLAIKLTPDCDNELFAPKRKSVDRLKMKIKNKIKANIM